MQNLIINANIWHTTNTPLGWAVNTSSHDVSSPFGKRGRKLESEKKGESESLSVASDSLGQFSRPEYLCPSPGDLPNPGIEPRFPALQADSLPAEPQGKTKSTGVGSLIPSPGDLPDPGIEPGSPALQADALPTEQ